MTVDEQILREESRAPPPLARPRCRDMLVTDVQAVQEGEAGFDIEVGFFLGHYQELQILTLNLAKNF